MTLDAPTYFGHLRAYVNDRYVMHDGAGGEVVLRQKYFLPQPATRAKTRKIRLLLPGPGLAFKLDHDQFQLRKRKSKPPLFHFPRRHRETVVETLRFRDLLREPEAPSTR